MHSTHGILKLLQITFCKKGKILYQCKMSVHANTLTEMLKIPNVIFHLLCLLFCFYQNKKNDCTSDMRKANILHLIEIKDILKYSDFHEPFF